ncbi:hypothetical protein RND81_05G097400 [Saponaria officinalis]|uniref:F-box domain-containing protein n=2 Tax=Saponaria officinalis TaxID=3572 RepID=A0AAW1KZI4_SAPOF
MIRPIDRCRKIKKRRLKTSNIHQNDVVSSPISNHLLVHAEIPEELIFSEILTRLPVKTLIKFKLVSKTWNSLISTPLFIKSHLKQTISNPYVPYNCVFIRSPYYFYILNYGAYDRCPNDRSGEKGLIHVNNLNYYDNGVNTFLIGSCNGLVCFGRGGAITGYDYCFYVYNPVMDLIFDVLDPLGNFQWMLMCGFGYVSCKDDYLLLVGGLQKRSSKTFVYDFSLKSKTWRKIRVFDEGELSIFSGGKGVLVNETLHWDLTQVWTPGAKSVCGFDLVDETFKEVEIPLMLLDNRVNLGFKLCEINGCLGGWVVFADGVVEMWMLKQYGAWESWMNLFKFDMLPGFRNFCGWTENGKVLLQTDDGSLLLADPKQNPTKYNSLVNYFGDIETVSFVQTAVSPFF